MIPIILAGLAGYALSNPRRRKHRRRRNPEMFKWKISKPILAELFVFEVENIDTEDREGSAKEMALAIEAAGSRGPKTLTLSRAASWDLHDALDNAADIHNDGGYGDQRALARAEAKMRDKIAATLNGASTEPTIAPSKKIPGKFIIGIGGKAIKGADGATLYFGSHADAEKHLTKPNPRRNPLSLDALALPAASLLWRKHGYQSPGHAEDLAMMARRGTTAAKLWARVAQITKGWLYGGKKRSNPPRGLSKEARAYLRVNKRARAAHDRHDWREADRLQAEAMAHYRKASADEQQAIQAAEMAGMMKGVAKALFPKRKR